MKTFRILRTVSLGGVVAGCALVAQKRGWQRVEAKQVPEQVPETGAPANLDNLELIQVQVFFRHGARTPLRLFDGMKDAHYDKVFHSRVAPHTNLPYSMINLDTGGPAPRSRMNERQLTLLFEGGMPSGQLTAVGRGQTYELGRRLRQRYVQNLNFVDQLYNSTDVYVRSTNVKRCVESLRCVMSGLFGVQQFEKNGGLVIPVSHMFHEYLYPNLRFCGTLRHFQALTPGLLMTVPQYRDTANKVNSKLGQDPGTYCDMMHIRDQIVAARTHGLQVPEWLLELEPDVTAAAFTGLEYFVTGDPQHKNTAVCLASGRIYHMIENNMNHIIEEPTSTAKLHLYSCHDTSVYPILVAIGYPIQEWPPYAADVTFELYADRQTDGQTDRRKQHWVRIAYMGEEFVPPGHKKALMTYEEFRQLIEPVVMVPERYRLACDDIQVAREFARMAVSREKSAAVESEAPPMM